MKCVAELRKSNGDYTEAGLKYPGMKADLDLCWKYLYELCQIVWAGNPNRQAGITMWSIPPQPDNFDMQLAATFDELDVYRATGLSPEYCAELAAAEKDGRLIVLPEQYSVAYAKGVADRIIAEAALRQKEDDDE